jgi:hypothetical protein
MPVLRQVQPMVAAGSSGIGSVTRDPMAGAAPLNLGDLSDASASVVAPSVWRTARTGMDRMPLHALDEIELPAFLRRDDATARDASPGRMRFGIDRRTEVHEPGPAQALLAGKAAAFGIVRAFNAAVQPGLGFRQVLRAVTEHPLDPRILKAVEVAAGFAGTRIKGWACFLLWVHQLDVPEARLSADALALVTAQLQGVDVEQQRTVRPLFEVATA